MKALKKAIKYVGGVGRLAEILGEKQPTVSNWKMRGSVPPNHCLAIEKATNGHVTVHDLRPDIFGKGGKAA